jgi:uncharacterized membrane protein
MNMNTLDEIAKLKGLLDDGAITQEEFETMKADLLAKGDVSDNATYETASSGTPGGNESTDAGSSANYGSAPGPEQCGQQGQPNQQYEQQQYQQSGQQQYSQPNYGAGGPGHVAGTPYANYQEDVAANKVFGILAYISFLCVVSTFAAPKESHYARFHANQGLVLFITEIAGFIILSIAGAMSGLAGFYAGFGAAAVISIILVIFDIAMVILAVIGIVNAVQGNEKNLPVIGGIRILK